jgi:hypothetical protein
VSYRDVAAISKDIKEVTPANGMIYAFEAAYFEGGILPPPGLENRFNPRSSAEQWLAAGRFDTVCISATDPRLKSYDLFSRYGKSKEITANGVKGYLLWDKK